MDLAQGLALANEIEDPAHKVWALAMISLQDPSIETKIARLIAAQELLEKIKESKRKAFVGYILTHAWLGTDQDALLADLNSIHYTANPW